MGKRKRTTKRRKRPPGVAGPEPASPASEDGKLIVPAFTAVILLLIAAAVAVVLKPTRTEPSPSINTTELVPPPPAEPINADALARRLLGLPDEPTPEQIIGAVQQQLARKDYVLASPPPGRPLDPREDPVLQSMPTPGEAAAWLASSIPQDAPKFALALKAIAEQRSDDAVLLLEQLQSELDASPNPANEDVALIRVARADADYFAGRFESAAEGYRSALPLFPRDPVIRYNLAVALIRVPPPGEADRLIEAIQILTDLDATAFTSKDLRVERGLVKLALGLAYWNLSVGDTAVSRGRAVEQYEGALEFLSRQDHPAVWARTHATLGDLFRDRRDGERAENLALAMDHYRQALLVFDRDRWPRQWAGLHANLGDAYSALPVIRPADLQNNLSAAVLAYEKALSVLRREASPVLWASTQIALGTAYNKLTDENAVENLSRAVSCFESALTVFDRSGYPADWAIAHNNLGTAEINLAEKDDPARRQDHLEKSVRYFQAALEVLDPSSHPIEWASGQANLGAAYLARAQGSPRDNLLAARSCFERAASILTPARFPDLANAIQENLVQIRSRLEALGAS